MGEHQRRRIAMTPDEVSELLDQGRTMTMCTMNHDGTIHAVAMWYGMLEGSVATTTKARSQKVQNLRRDPRLTCLVEAGEAYEELRGVELVGRAEIVEEPERLRVLAGDLLERRSVAGEQPETGAAVEALLHKRVGIRFAQVDRVVSWDHRKLQP
jgi:PPOX class probable F420-dependent enzyme